MTTFYTLLSGLLFVGYWLLIAGVTLRVLMKRRSVTSSMAWLLIIYILPLLGIIAYFSFGELYLGKRRAERAITVEPYRSHWLNELKNRHRIFAINCSDIAQSLFQLCENRQGVAAVTGNSLSLFTHTEKTINSLILDIERAHSRIDIIFYIWQPGGVVDKVSESLMSAAQRGVRCRLMLDSAGSVFFFHTHWPEKMRQAGVEVVEVLKVSLLRVFFRRMDLRQHRKIILIDNNIAYTGSMNMVDPKRFKQNAGVGQWIDIMTRMEGPVTAIMDIVFAGDWEMETAQQTIPPTSLHVSLPEKQAEEIQQAIQVIASGPGFPEDMLHQALLTAVWSARHKLVMTTPYFSPSDNLLHAICTAALRGVDVKLIIPHRNDSLLVGWASRAFFTELLGAGVKIYQFEGGLLHTKSVLVDDQLSLTGSANLDMRSLWLNFELTVVIDDKKFGEDLAKIQNKYIANARLIDANSWSKRPYWNRILERLFYFLSPLL